MQDIEDCVTYIKPGKYYHCLHKVGKKVSLCGNPLTFDQSKAHAEPICTKCRKIAMEMICQGN